MKKISIFKIIKWAWFPIVLFCIVGEFLFTSYIQNKQVYTAQTVISYVNPEAEKGLSPDGKSINIKEITSSSVIKEAIDRLGISYSVESIRKCCNVAPVIPEDEEVKKESTLKDGETYTYFPTEYLVTFHVNSAFKKSEFNAAFARQMLDTLLDCYLETYGSNHINYEVIPDDCSKALSDEYDYIESVEIVDNALDDLITYCYARSDSSMGYRSSRTGYTFKGILLRYQNLNEMSVSNLYATVLNNGLTKDYDLLQKKYERRTQNNELDVKAYDQKIELLEKLIADYSAQDKNGQQKDPAYLNNNNHVIEFRDDDEYGKKHSKTTSYDSMMLEDVDFYIGRDYCNIENKYFAFVIDQIGANRNKNSYVRRRNFETELENVATESAAIYDILQATVSEYNAYLGAKNVTVESTVSVDASINTKLYTLLSLLVLVFAGVGGTIALFYLATIFERLLYKDRKTGLHNRRSFDRTVEKMSGDPLSDDTSCVVLLLKNLSEVNDKMGREYGNVMLYNLGVMIRNNMTGYGEIFYNGGIEFVGLFDKCDEKRAEGFISDLADAVKLYNRQYPDYGMDLAACVYSPKTTGIYNAHKLVRKTMTDAMNAPSIVGEEHEESEEKDG